MPPPSPARSSPADSLLALLQTARQGSLDALGRLLELYRPYLLQIANDELPAELRGKVGGSDLVQQTFLEARRDFPSFAGAGDDELRGWLRRILRNNVATCVVQFQTQKRAVKQEVTINGRAGQLVVAEEAASPSANLRRREQAEAVERALARLPEEQRVVIVLRGRERRSFPEIAQQMGRTMYSVRQLWAQAVERLQKELAGLP